MFNSQTGFVSNFVEQDGCARTVIVLLLLTTVGCISYTWGYYEGIANGQSNLMLDKLHELQLIQMAKNGSEPRKHAGGHGMRLAEVQSEEQLNVGIGLHEPATAGVDLATTKAAATLEDATTGAHGKQSSKDRAKNTQLRGVIIGEQTAEKRGSIRKSKPKAAGHAEET